MTLPAKLGVGVLALGSCTAAGCIGVIYSQQGTAISELVEKEYQYILLNTSTNTDNKDNEYWKTNWDTYKRENAQNVTGKDIFQLSGWTLNNQKDLTTELKAKCSKLSSLFVSDNKDKNYQNVIKYCGRGVTVRDEAANKGWEVIDTEASVIDPAWGKKNTNKLKIKSELAKLGIDFNSINETKIKDGCKNSQIKNKQSSDFSEYYVAYVKVCTKQPEDDQP